VTRHGGEDVWKIVALVDLSCPDADRVVENALTIGDRLRGDVTLLSVVARHLYERGVRHHWTQNAFGKTHPSIDIHRLALPGTPTETLAMYADRIRADVVVMPAEYNVRRWLRKRPLASAVATLVSRPLWIVPATAGAWSADGPLRVGCVVRLDGADDHLCSVAQSIARRCGGEVVLIYATGPRPGLASPAGLGMDRLGRALDRPWSTVVVENCSNAALSVAVVENRLGLLVTGRPLAMDDGANAADSLYTVNQLACPVLSVPISPVSTSQSRDERAKRDFCHTAAANRTILLGRATTCN
jgi:nucleotide-binding universal stress UspA family protein